MVHLSFKLLGVASISMGALFGGLCISGKVKHFASSPEDLVQYKARSLAQHYKIPIQNI